MTRGPLLVILAMLICIGIADSFYLAESAVRNETLVCDIDGLSGCNAVAQSEYSQLFGIPLGVYGVGFYILSLVMIVLLKFSPRRLYHQLFLGLSVFGALASLCFMGIQVFLIQAMCVYCIGSALITFLMVPLAYMLFRRFAPSVPAVIA